MILLFLGGFQYAFLLIANNMIGLVPIDIKYILLIFVITALYCVVAIFAKRYYIKKYGEDCVLHGVYI